MSVPPRETLPPPSAHPPGGARPGRPGDGALLGWRGGAATGYGERIDAVGRQRVLFLGSPAAAVPAALAGWADRAGLVTRRVTGGDALMHEALRGRPRLAAVDARGAHREAGLRACVRIKADSYTAIVPTLCVVDPGAGALAEAFAAGADEVITEATGELEAAARLTAMLRRAERDLGVHPTTRLPGTPELEGELTRRLAAGEPFAACYADLDHFKEFNDRYGYNEGDRVIRMVGRLLHDVVKGSVGEAGFVGHIGGDDFLFIVPLESAVEVCAAIVETFELLVPFQYSDADRRAGYYFGKDRRGQLHRVPLMSLSIGVATTDRRRYASALQVSRLASEMKSYAKTLPGSVYAVDRRGEAGPQRGGVERGPVDGQPEEGPRAEERR